MALLHNYLEDLKKGIKNNFGINSLNEISENFLNEEYEKYFKVIKIETNTVKAMIQNQNLLLILGLQNCLELKEAIRDNESIIMKDLGSFVNKEQAYTIVKFYCDDKIDENEYCVDNKLKDKNYLNNDIKLAFHYSEALFNEKNRRKFKTQNFIVWHRAIIKQINNLQNWPNQRVRNSVLNAWESNKNEEYFCLIFSQVDNYKYLLGYGDQLNSWFEQMKIIIEKRQKRGEFSKGEKSSAESLKEEFQIIKFKIFNDSIYKSARTEFVKWIYSEHFEHLNKLFFAETDYGNKLRMKVLKGEIPNNEEDNEKNELIEDSKNNLKINKRNSRKQKQQQKQIEEIPSFRAFLPKNYLEKEELLNGYKKFGKGTGTAELIPSLNIGCIVVEINKRLGIISQTDSEQQIALENSSFNLIPIKDGIVEMKENWLKLLEEFGEIKTDKRLEEVEKIVHNFLKGLYLKNEGLIFLFVNRNLKKKLLKQSRIFMRNKTAPAKEF
uniref:Uncharacterized protein n=1 Tax=Meloidogyne enterolobii TaxID=390850 RepID=A0A6V7WEC7_MELEN|nr:unnamed protein product [Meloidogyne enterolobii]